MANRLLSLFAFIPYFGERTFCYWYLSPLISSVLCQFVRSPAIGSYWRFLCSAYKGTHYTEDMPLKQHSTSADVARAGPWVLSLVDLALQFTGYKSLFKVRHRNS